MKAEGMEQKASTTLQSDKFKHEFDKRFDSLCSLSFCVSQVGNKRKSLE